MKTPYEIEPLGITLQPFRSAGYEEHVAYWNNGNDSHVYAARIRQVRDGWEATLENDGNKVGAVVAGSRSKCALLALGALRAYLLRGHRRTLRTMRRDAEKDYAACHPYDMDLLAACGFDLGLAHAVEAVALRRGFTPDRLRGADSAAIHDLVVEAMATPNTPDASNAPAKEGGAE